MKTKALVLAALAVSGLHAAEDLGSMFKEGKTSGEIRAFHVDRAYDGFSTAVHRNSTALGGHLKFETADYKGLSFGSAFYTTNRVLRDLERNVTSPALLSADGTAQNTLGESYIKYVTDKTTFVAGRHKIDTPLAGADDVRMNPNFHEGYILTNKSMENTTLTLGHLTKFSAGTFANIYSGGGILAATGGYSYFGSADVNTSRYPKQGEFQDIGEWTVGQKTNGASMASVVYDNKKMKLQVWDYMLHDILNAVYAQADMKYGDEKGFNGSFALQAIKENSTGAKLLKNLGTTDGEIDSLYWGVKAGVGYEGVSASLAYSETGANSADSNASYSNAIITPMGGMPAFTQGMVTRHMFLAGTKATKATLSYKTKIGESKLSAAVYGINFVMDVNNGYTTDATATETGFDIQYHPESVKNFLVRFRGNFPSTFQDKPATAEVVNWKEYRFILSYKF